MHNLKDIEATEWADLSMVLAPINLSLCRYMKLAP